MTHTGSGLEKVRLKLTAIKAAGGTVERLDPIEKSKRNPGSLRLAINAMCWHCAGAGADGIEFTKTTIRECKVIRCPLHHQRPHQLKAPGRMKPIEGIYYRPSCGKCSTGPWEQCDCSRLLHQGTPEGSHRALECG